MRLRDIAYTSRVSLRALEHAAAVLGISATEHVEEEDRRRLLAYLREHYTSRPTLGLGCATPSPRPSPPVTVHPPASESADASFKSGRTMKGTSGASVNKLEMKMFSGLAGKIGVRVGMAGLRLQRQTRNCGDTAALVLQGLKAIANVSNPKEVDAASALKDLRNPAVQHEVWDITVHQHTFILERDKGGQNMLIQSYQPGYNVQFWCSLPEAFIDDPALKELPKTWFRPSDEKLALMSNLIVALQCETGQERSETWKQLPFNPNDRFLAAGKVALTVNHYTFVEPAAFGVTVRAIEYSIKSAV